MVKRFNSQKLIIVAVSLSLIGFSCTRRTIRSVAPEPTSRLTEQSSKREATLTIDFGDEEIATYSATPSETMTAYDLLIKATKALNLRLDTETFDFGVFVKAIQGRESTAEKAWIYFINNEPGRVAADQAQIKSGDRVTWRYVKPS